MSLLGLMLLIVVTHGCWILMHESVCTHEEDKGKCRMGERDQFGKN